MDVNCRTVVTGQFKMLVRHKYSMKSRCQLGGKLLPNLQPPSFRAKLILKWSRFLSSSILDHVRIDWASKVVSFLSTSFVASSS